MGARSLIISWLLGVAVLTSAQDALRARPPRRSTSTEHLDKLSRDELLHILGEIESSGSVKSTKTSTPAKTTDYSTYPSVTAPPRRAYTTPQPSAPRYFTTLKPVPSSSDIDDLINKYKNRKNQSGSTTVEDLLRRLRNSNRYAPSAPSSTFNFPGPNYASRYPASSSGSSSSSSSRGSLPYPTSYNPALYPTQPSSYPPYPSSYGSSYPIPHGTFGSSSSRGTFYTTQPSSRLYPSLPSNIHSDGYSPSGTFGGSAPKYVTTTKKPKKNFFSKIFG